MRAALKPREDINSLFTHLVLDINLLVSIARPGERQSRQSAGAFEFRKFLLVEEVRLASLMAKEEPAGAWRTSGQ
jgi:hypothetical protein